MSLAQIMFWICFTLVITAMCMGLVGVWIPSSPTGRRLFLSNLVLIGGTLVLCLMSRYLGK